MESVRSRKYVDRGYTHLILPRWVRWLEYLLFWLPMLLIVSTTHAALTSLPPASREDAICGALGAEAPCVTVEVGSVSGTVSLIAYDTDLIQPVLAVVKVRGRTFAMPLSPSTEEHLIEVMDDPTTYYRRLVVPSVAWATLRELAKVTTGIAVIEDAHAVTLRRPQLNEDGLAEVRLLKVRVALLVLPE